MDLWDELESVACALIIDATTVFPAHRNEPNLVFLFNSFLSKYLYYIVSMFSIL